MKKFAEEQAFTREFFSQLLSDDTQMQKEAAQDAHDFTRKRVREEGVFRKIITPVGVEDSDLDRQANTDKNMIVIDMESDSPGAISVPYGGALSATRYIWGDRYAVQFDRIVGPRFYKDVSTLRNYRHDIRKVLSDNAVRDILAEEDGKAIRAVNTCLVSQGGTVPETGTVQWTTIAGGISRINWVEGLKVMGSTPMSLEPQTVVMNHMTVKDLGKWGYGEMGGDMAGEISAKGFTSTTFWGKTLIVSIKRRLFPDGSVFYFADEEFLGKFFVLEDVTLGIDRKHFMIEFFPYEEIGITIGNVAGLARVDFTGSISASY